MMDSKFQLLIARGLTATKMAVRLAIDTTPKIRQDVTDTELLATLDALMATYHRWDERISRALGEAGQAGESDPVVLKTIYDAGRKIRQHAADVANRDLEIVQNQRLALHTWIVTFDMLRIYALRLRLDKTERDMRTGLNEANDAEAVHAGIAERIVAATP